MHLVTDVLNIILCKSFTFMLTCVKIQFQGPSGEIGR